MNKKQRLQIQQAKKVAPITIQEAWNIVSKYMHKTGEVSFFVDSYNNEPCTLYSYDNASSMRRILHFKKEEK